MNDKIIGILIGAILTITIIQVVGIAVAHEQNGALSDVQSHMDHHMGMMDGHMKNMECMGMEVEDMDNDGDGICDVCGMSVAHCAEMKSTMQCHK